MGLQEIAECVLRLVRETWETNQDVQDVYWFPDETEIRLIEITPNQVIGLCGEVEPFYFDATKEVPYPFGLAVINTNDVGKLRLPPRWGEWNDAIVLQRESRKPKGKTINKDKDRTRNLVNRVKCMGLTPMFTHMHRIYPTDTGLNKILGGTTCVLFNENMEPVGRGNCIVSKKDRPIRAVGRYISLRRALKALFTQMTQGKLCTWKYFQCNYHYFKHFEECRGYSNATFIPECVSKKELTLTTIEKKRLINRKEKRRSSKQSKQDETAEHNVRVAGRD